MAGVLIASQAGAKIEKPIFHKTSLKTGSVKIGPKQSFLVANPTLFRKVYAFYQSNNL